MTRRYIARFVPQAWINDYALDVDPEGEQEWDCTDFLAAHPELRVEVDKTCDSEWDEWLDRDDQLMHDQAKPAWIKNWSGPFSIYVTIDS